MLAALTGLGGVLTLVLHALLMLGSAPLLDGLLRRGQARLHGRAGPPVLQPYRDLLRLLRKQPVVAENASPVFLAAPGLVAATTIGAMLLLPSFALGMATAGLSDLLLLAGLLANGRMVLALAAWDTGTAFGGAGATRVMLFAAFAEPALLLVVFVLALLVGTTNLDTLAGLLRDGQAGLRVSLVLALAALVLVSVVENGRVPVDGPAPLAELATTNAAMTLEYSGWHLALAEYAASLRLLLWLTLIATVFMPFGLAAPGFEPLDWLLGLLLWAVKVGGLACGLVVFESATARMRVFRVPEFLGAAILLGLLAIVFLFVSQGLA